jgi:hypothetical protein
MLSDMEASFPADARVWARGLQLYDEPHGSEYFVIDPMGKFPVWYRLDGSVFTNSQSQPTQPPEVVRWAIEYNGWSEASLYPNSHVE